jgi:hypothetical protein
MFDPERPADPGPVTTSWQFWFGVLVALGALGMISGLWGLIAS